MTKPPESVEVLAEKAARAAMAEAAAQARLIREFPTHFVRLFRWEHEQGKHYGTFVDGCPLCEYPVEG